MDSSIVAYELQHALTRAFTLYERFALIVPGSAALVAREALIANNLMKAYWRGKWNESEVERAYNTTLSLDAAVNTMLLSAGIDL